MVIQEKFFDKIFDVNPLPGLLLLPDAPLFTIADVNFAYLTITNTKKADLVGKGIIEALPYTFPVFCQEIIFDLHQSLLMVISTGKLYIIEIKNWKVENIPIPGDDGNTAIIFHTIKDVRNKPSGNSEYKNADAHIRESERLYRTLFEQNLAGFYQTTLEGVILNCNNAFAKMLKYDSRDDLLTKNAAVLYFSLPERNTFIDKVKDQKILYNNEGVLKCKDGSKLYYLENICLRKNEVTSQEYLDGTIIDITSRMKTLLELKESNERFINVSKATSDAIWDWDLVTNNLYWGKGFETLFGYKISGNKANISTWYDHIHPEEKQKVLDSIYSVINDKNNNNWKQEYRYIKADGDYANVFDKGFVIRNERGVAYRMAGAMQDITILKNREFALQISEARNRDIIASQTNYVIRTDLNGMYTYYNQRFVDDYGWMYNSQSLMGQTGLLSVKEYHHQRVLDAVTICLANPNKVFKVEIDKPSMNGEVKTSLWDFVCLTNSSGEPLEIQCMGIDISDRKEAEVELLKSFEEKNIILEIIGDGFFAVDKNFIVTYWNSQAEKMLDKPRAEVVGCNLWDLFPDRINFKAYRKYYRALETNEIVHFENHYDPLDKWFEISVYPLENGLSVYFKDITERKKNDEVIRLNKERYDMVAKATNDCVWDWDLIKNEVIRPAKKLEVHLGHEEVNSMEVEAFWNEHMPAEDAARIVKNINKLFANSSENYWHDTYRFLKPDGQYAYISDTAYIIRNKEGKAIRMIGASRDISRDKEGEIKLKELNKELLKQARDLQSSNTDLEQFAYVASHDLQEPLRMITGFLTLLEKNYLDIIDDKGKNYIGFAVDGAQRMKQIIIDLLEYSRIGITDDKKEEVKVEEVVKEILILYSKKITEKNAIIKTGILPLINTYKALLRQVFQNLIANALEYTRDNIAVKINITAKVLNDFWEFSVTDNGIGIEEENFEKIFLIFQRLHHKDQFSGTGIGLAVTKKIISNMGGNIWVESTPGKGSTFYFTVAKGNK